MGRTLKRVPLDFDWEQKKTWYGYLTFNKCTENCDDCKQFAKLKGYKVGDESWSCPEYPELDALREPPIGEGYQMWETTSEGSPASPVFKTLDELCEWCAENATRFADFKATKEKWKEMFDADFVCHKMNYDKGTVVFI